MTDRYERIRQALAMGPTPGPWEFNKNPKEGECPLVYGPNQTPLMDHISDEAPPDYFERWIIRDADAAYIAACDPDTIRELLAERDQLAAALEAAREDAWQPIETAPKPDIGADGFGERLLLVVDCGGGTIQSVRKGYWEGTDWHLDCCSDLATACGYRVTHWRPLPAPPAIDQARGKAGQEVGK